MFYFLYTKNAHQKIQGVYLISTTCIRALSPESTTVSLDYDTPTIAELSMWKMLMENPTVYDIALSV